MNEQNAILAIRPFNRIAGTRMSLEMAQWLFPRIRFVESDKPESAQDTLKFLRAIML